MKAQLLFYPVTEQLFVFNKERQMQLDSDDIDILIDGLKLEIDSCEEFIRCWDYKGNENNEDVVDEKKRLKKAKKLLDFLCSNDYYINILNSQ